MTQPNGGREQSYLDTLSQEQRDLVKYVQGMPEPMQSAWTIAQIHSIRASSEAISALITQRLHEQAKAVADALAAANPPRTALSTRAVTLLTGTGIVIGGIVMALVQKL